jgi:hypothetical protein
MDTTEIKRLFQAVVNKLRDKDGSFSLTFRLGLLALSSALGMLGYNTDDFWDDES